MALEPSELDGMKVVVRPRLLSDNGSAYISGELAEGFGEKSLSYVRRAPLHRRINGKIVPWYQMFKYRVLRENCNLSGDLEQKMADHNLFRLHQHISNLAPVDVYCGRRRPSF